MNSQQISAVIGVAAVIIGAIYFINVNRNGEAEKLGDSIENTAEEVVDGVKDAAN